MKLCRFNVYDSMNDYVSMIELVGEDEEDAERRLKAWLFARRSPKLELAASWDT